MKVWELEEGKEYVTTDKNFGEKNYKIEDGELIYFDEEEGWSLSLRNFKQLNDLNFTEYTPPTDWSKVEVDTKVLVSNDNINWYNRHFAKYENGRVYAWVGGYTSFTWKSETDCEDKEDAMMSWNYAKLYKEE